MVCGQVVVSSGVIPEGAICSTALPVMGGIHLLSLGVWVVHKAVLLSLEGSPSCPERSPSKIPMEVSFWEEHRGRHSRVQRAAPQSETDLAATTDILHLPYCQHWSFVTFHQHLVVGLLA